VLPTWRRGGRTDPAATSGKISSISYGLTTAHSDAALNPTDGEGIELGSLPISQHLPLISKSLD
jgi:hypothetical protein